MNEALEQKMRDLKVDDVLAFKPVGRPLALAEVRDEFRLMQSFLKSPLTADVACRICGKTGSHLLKLISPRAGGDQACLYIEPAGANRRPKVLPSTNAPDIPFCKVIFRPLEILGHPSRCVIDDIMNPDDISPTLLEDFASVFGQDVLDTMQKALLASPKRVTKLAAGEFPIIFVPRPGGGDLQITPVSPATAFMGMKSAIAPFFGTQVQGGPRTARGRFHKQTVSAKPQNISGVIGGPRTRLEAVMPRALGREEAEIHRCLKGGSFPRWRDSDIATWLLRYADMLEADSTYSDSNTRAALDRTADRLIREACEFIAETCEALKDAAIDAGIDPATLSDPPLPSLVLMRHRWPDDAAYARARRAVTSAHFEHRLRHVIKEQRGASA